MKKAKSDIDIIVDNVRKEHKEMSRCPHCKSNNVRKMMQGFTFDFTDIITYQCIDCRKTYEKEFDVMPTFKKVMRNKKKRKRNEKSK